MYLKTLITFWVILFSVTNCQAATNLESLLKKSGFSTTHLWIKNDFIKMHGLVGNKKVAVILDTGSSDISVAANVPKIFGLTRIKTNQKAMDSQGNIVPVYKVVLPSLTISGHKQMNVCATVLSLNWHSKLPIIVIGRALMKKYHMIMDLAQLKLFTRLNNPTHTVKSHIIQSLQHNSYYAIPLLNTSTGALLIPIQIDKQMPTKFLFDSGTGVTLINRDYAKKLGLIGPGYQKNSVIIHTFVFNPLDTSVSSPIFIKNVSAQLNDLTSLNHVLKVQGILGLSEMLSENMLIAPFINTVYIHLEKS